MHRYGDVDRICDMPWQNGIQIIRKASEKDVESRIWEMWLAQLPNMDEEHFISFSDYKDKLLNVTPKKKQQTVDEQIAMCRLLNAAFGGEVVEA